MTARQAIRLAKAFHAITCVAIALAIAFLLSTSHYLDGLRTWFGPDDIATESLVASAVADLGAQPTAATPATPRWHQLVREHIRIACGHSSRGWLNKDGDIQCTGPDGKPAFFVYTSSGGRP